MKKISFFKRYQLFRAFKKAIKENRNELEQKFGVRVDRAYRLYTILNIPEELIGEAFTLRKSDIDRISEPLIREYTSELSNYLNSIGLSEIYDFYELRKEEKLAWKIVIGYKFFRSNEWYDTLYFRVLPISLLFSLIISLIIIFS
jgi:hypothetical protein